MDFKIKNKVAIVTGSADGIGKATAFSLAAEGVLVCMADTNNDTGLKSLAELQCKYPDNGMFVNADISMPGDVQKLFDEAYTKFGSIDILINNAGISYKVPFEDITYEDFQKILSVNLTGTFLCCQEAYKYMSAQKWGRIVSLSSMAGRYGAVVAGAHYSASKAGILGLTMTLAKRMGENNVTINTVAPGRINTRMTKELPEDKLAEIVAKIPLKRVGSPEEVADVITFLCSEQAGYVTGACVDILGGYIG